jgi:hypothetical protein
MSLWHYYCIILTIDSFSLIADKAKPRVIVGRKATGPDGIAGLPKQDQMDRILAAFLGTGIRFLIIKRFSEKGTINESGDKGVCFGQSYPPLRSCRLRIWNPGVWQEAIGKLSGT